MKAIAKCPKCGETLITYCGGCIIAGICAHHECKKSKNEIITGIKWKEIPEDESELKKLEEI